MDGQHDFCRLSLRFAREEAKQAGVEVPKGLTTWRDSGNSGWAEVWNGSEQHCFSGCCCSFIAKAKYISSLIEKANK